MFRIPQELIEDLVAPVVSAQIFLTILIYFTLVRKRIAAEYKLYLCFLTTFIIFLLGRTVQQFSTESFGYPVLYLRMALLFSLGLPSLLIAAAIQSGMKRSKFLLVGPFLAGSVISIAYVAYADASITQLFVNKEMLEWLPLPVALQTAHRIQIWGAIIMLVLPCSYLIFNELRFRPDSKLLAFLTGSLLFGIFLVVGTLGSDRYGIYYIGSIASALCWGWAVFHDIRDMKGKVALLKDELQRLVRHGDALNVVEIGSLLQDLEDLSHGNLDVYKMRIREILGMLTDTTIEAGGDPEELIRRHTDRGHAVEASENPQVIKEIVYAEALELSEMIAEIPQKKRSETIERAKVYLREHYSSDFGIDELAASLRVSRAHLMREFKKETGQTVNQCLTRIRIERAKELLAKKSVTETAFEVGFNNSNYFSTVFKKQTGFTPGQFKNSLSSEDSERTT